MNMKNAQGWIIPYYFIQIFYLNVLFPFAALLLSFIAHKITQKG